MEEIKELIEKAEDYDKLTSLRGWERVLNFMVSDVNGTITHAKALSDSPEKQVRVVNQWDAKCQFLDRVIAEVNGAMEARDRIVEEFKAKENLDGGSSGAETH